MQNFDEASPRKPGKLISVMQVNSSLVGRQYNYEGLCIILDTAY